MATNPVVSALLARFREIREAQGQTAEDLNEALILGPGWVERFESGETVPGIDVLVVMLDALGSNLTELLSGIDDRMPVDEGATAVERFIRAEETDGSDDLSIHFTYADHDATYRLPHASLGEFDEVIKTLRNGLAKLVEEDLVTRAS